MLSNLRRQSKQPCGGLREFSILFNENGDGACSTCAQYGHDLPKDACLKPSIRMFVDAVSAASVTCLRPSVRSAASAQKRHVAHPAPIDR